MSMRQREAHDDGSGTFGRQSYLKLGESTPKLLTNSTGLCQAFQKLEEMDQWPNSYRVGLMMIRIDDYVRRQDTME
jgi:hypothetical protein